MAKIDQLKLAAATEKPTTVCPSGSGHTWVLVQAAGNKSLDDKIKDLKASPKAGTQFEGAAAEHNKNDGTLKDSKDLSDDSDQLSWECAFPGCNFKNNPREGDHVTTDGAGKRQAVEVKATTALDERSARQLGRNLQAASQGAVAGVTMKIPAGPQRSTLVSQIKQVAASLGQAVQIIRV